MERYRCSQTPLVPQPGFLNVVSLLPISLPETAGKFYQLCAESDGRVYGPQGKDRIRYSWCGGISPRNKSSSCPLTGRVLWAVNSLVGFFVGYHLCHGRSDDAGGPLELRDFGLGIFDKLPLWRCAFNFDGRQRTFLETKTRSRHVRRNLLEKGDVFVIANWRKYLAELNSACGLRLLTL